MKSKRKLGEEYYRKYNYSSCWEAVAEALKNNDIKDNRKQLEDFLDGYHDSQFSKILNT
jgi:hypothetical protein